MIKVGMITIGQSPRDDVLNDIVPILGSNIELIQAGALDNLTLSEIEKEIPNKDKRVLVSRLKDGTEVRVSEERILPVLQQKINELENKGVCMIIFLCTDDFPEVFESSVPLIFPYRIISAFLSVLNYYNKIGVVVPDESQVTYAEQKWKKNASYVTAVAATPYGNSSQLNSAAKILKNTDVELVIMDCIGYTELMKRNFREVSRKNIILPRTLTAKVIREILD